MKVEKIGAWLNASVARKIIVSLVVGTTFVLLLVGTSSLFIYRNYLIRQTELTLANAVNLLSSSLSIPVWGLDSKQIVRIIDSVMLDKQIVAIKLNYADGQIFRGRSPTGIVDLTTMIPDQKSLYLESTLTHDKAEIGTLRLYYSNQMIKEKFNHFLIIFCVVVSLLDVALIIVSYLLIRKIVVAPLISMKNYALGVMGIQTQSTTDVDTTYIGELSSLSNSIQEMIKLEREARAKVDDYRRNLEKLVEERTKQLRDREMELDRANVMAGIGHWKRDEATKQVTWSDEIYRIFGLEPRSIEVYPDFFLKFIHPDDLEEFSRHRGEMLKPGGLVRMDLRIITARQEVRWIHVEASGEFDGNGILTSVSGTIQDITERKKTEDNLIAAKKEADAANKSKSIFLANMSHELRTPLNSIIGFSKMLLTQPLLPDQKKYAEIIHRAGMGLIELINDILNISKIEAGKEEVFNQSTYLPSLVDDIMFMMSSRTEHLPIKVFHTLKDVPTFLMLDQAKIRQVLVNLLSNAIKFTKMGEVELTIEGQTIDNFCILQFCVKDTGIGIATTDQKRIFQPFEQVAQVATNQGTGLGLTISKNLVALMGGQLALDSELGTGSKFHFSLKVPIDHSTPQRQSRTISYNPINPLALKVLIVDDVEDARLLLTDMMKTFGCECTVAKNGDEARRYFKEKNPDIVFVDFHMPDVSGLNLAAEFRAASAEVLILMETADAASDLPKLAKAAGVNHLITKPIHLEKLLAIISQHFNYPSAAHEFSAPKHDSMPNLTRNDLNSLSDEVRENVLASLRGLNPSTIADSVDKVRQENNELAERLKKLVDNLQYRYIWDAWGISASKIQTLSSQVSD